ncbi:MAG TPA: HAD family phosphatase [Candidatus Limnocylindria bacterium]
MAPPLALPRPLAVILDLDGTLVDTVDTRIRAWLAAFDEFRIPATRQQLAPLIGMDGRRLARQVAEAAGLALPPDRDEEIDRRCGAIFESLNADPRPLPAAADFIAAVQQRGIDVAIATSSRREQVATSVRALGLAQEPVIVDGSSVLHAKPEPDLLLLAAEQVDRPPESCWYVGDSTWDMRAAVAARMRGVGVTAGAAVDADALRAAGAAAVVATLAELIGPLGGA